MDEITALPPGWQLSVELEGITWDDMLKLSKITERLGWTNTDVQFRYDDEGRHTHIVLEDA